MSNRGRKLAVQNGIPPTPEVQGSTRELLSLWYKQRLDEIERANAERIELLRTVGEHPSPVFAKIVRIQGQLGMPKTLVAKMLGITSTTLINHYGDDYDLGHLDALTPVAANAIRMAASIDHPDAARAMMYVLDRRGGEEWKAPAKKVEVDDKRDKPPLIDSSKLNREERQQLRAMLTRVAAGGEGDPVDPNEGMDLIE